MNQPSRDPSLLARALFPALATDLDAALARDRGPNAGERFDAWLDASATQMLADVGFDDIADPATAKRFERAFAAMRAVAPLIGAQPPEPEELTAAGTDFARLAELAAMDDDLVPVVAPYGIDADEWSRIFSRAAAEPSSPFALQPHGGSPLIIGSEAVREFEALAALPPDAPLVTREGEITWALRLVPAGDRPPTLGLGFVHGPHATLPEMLMLQLMRAVEGLAPVDAASFTWLAGPLAGGRLAARHVYDAGERAIRITCREIGNQGPHLGARTPVV